MSPSTDAHEGFILPRRPNDWSVRFGPNLYDEHRGEKAVRYRSMILARVVALGFVLLTSQLQGSDTLQRALQVLQAVGREGQGHQAAVEAWPTVAASGADQLPNILSAMDDANPLADNWIRGAVDAIAERTIASGGKLPADQLDAYVANRSKSGRSRRLAYEWLVKVDDTATDRWATKLLEDSSLELRRDAVARKLAEGAEAESNEDKVAAYRVAFTHARDLDQIEEATQALKELDEEVDIANHFGFLRSWHLIGPFDNMNKSGFDKVYPPEQDVDLEADYPGQEEAVHWKTATTDDEHGLVNLNEELGKHKGAAAYAFTEFTASEARDVELRLGSMNANKIWLNGELLTANHVYHAGNGIDQYVGKGKLKPGRNVILLKICQNEQTESWAQDWEFQLRVCDEIGTAVLPE